MKITRHSIEMRSLIYVLMFILMLCVNCESVGKGNIVNSPTDLPLITEEPDKDESLQADTFPTEVSTMRQPTRNRPTLEENNKVEKACVKINDEKNIYVSIAAFFNPEEQEYELLNLQNGEKKIISGKRNEKFTASPDRKSFAFHDKELNQLLVYSSTGQQLYSLDWSKDWGRLGQWLGKEQILIEMTKSEPNNPNFNEYPETLLLLNLATGEKSILPPDYPDIDQGAYIKWPGTGSTVYDPQLSRVIYPGNSYEVGLVYLMWNISDHRTINIPEIGLGGNPIWFQNGEKFILNGHDGEFYLGNRNGEVTQITQLNQAKTSYYSTYYSISPDNQKIGFWLETADPQSTQLAIFDMEDQSVKELCLSAGYNPMKLLYNPTPIWSPDSRYLMVEGRISEKEDSEVFIIDTETLTASRISNNRNPLGWLIQP